MTWDIKGGIIMQKGFVIVLILAVLIGIFAISNSGVVTIDFIFAEIDLSQAIVIFICVLLGALLASIFGGIRQMSLKKNIRQLKSENDILQKQIEKLSLELAERKEVENKLRESQITEELIDRDNVNKF